MKEEKSCYSVNKKLTVSNWIKSCELNGREAPEETATFLREQCSSFSVKCILGKLFIQNVN